MFLNQTIILAQHKNKYATEITEPLLNDLCEYCNRVFSRGLDISEGMTTILNNYCYHRLQGSDVMMVILNEIHKLVTTSSQGYFCTYVNLVPKNSIIFVKLQLTTSIAI